MDTTTARRAAGDGEHERPRDLRSGPGLAGAFARLGGEDDEQVWSGLWNDLCHLNCVDDDSFPALPYLAAVADGRAPGAPHEAVSMAGLIVSAADEEQTARYTEEIAVFLRTARRLLGGTGDDTAAFVYLLQGILAFEGERVWSAGRLEGLFTEEYEVDCPACSSTLFVAFGAYGTFASAGDYVTSDPVRAALLPADPAALDPLPARLHRMAAEAGQEEVAHRLTYLFGRATCPDCEEVFAVPDQVLESC
ncbi:hypothetical protein [Streptomyces erythrochromogenes]|uniref:hypothetical protein n=1 Tax=Streptomyces erythrochromogenes TaxID=285574 RepID=UPI0033CDC67B